MDCGRKTVIVVSVEYTDPRLAESRDIRDPILAESDLKTCRDRPKTCRVQRLAESRDL